jgi:hypothetical protein
MPTKLLSNSAKQIYVVPGHVVALLTDQEQWDATLSDIRTLLNQQP